MEVSVGEAVGKIYVDRYFSPGRQGADGSAGREPDRGVPALHYRS